MKSLAIFCIITFSLFANAGGVTIGNGTSYIVGIDLPAFKEEVELFRFTKGLVKETRSGRLLRIREFKEQGKCDKELSELKGLDAFEYFPHASANELGERYVKGQLVVELFDCKTPELINHDGFGDIDLAGIHVL